MESRTLLHVLVTQRRWTYADFRKAFEKTAQELARRQRDPSLGTVTVAEQTFRRWTAGNIKTLPVSPTPVILEHLFQQPAHDLFKPPGDAVLPSPPAPPAIHESELLMTARHAADHAGEAAAQALPDLTLDQLEDDVLALARTYPATAPADSHRRGAELLRLAQAMLDRTQRPRQRERLYLQAGATAALLASAGFDLGSLPAAVQFARTAALYGEVIDHGPLQAYAHGTLAYLAYWDARPLDAVRLVARAERFGGLGDTAAVRLATIAARAHAHLGDGPRAREAIAAAGADRATGRRDELHDDLGGEFGMPAERAVMSHATTLLLLADAEAAEETAGRALALIDGRPPEQRPALRGKAAADLARARLMRGELDGAAEAVAPVLGLGGEWRTLGVLERVTALRLTLLRGDLHAASAGRELGEALEAFTASAAARPLGAASPLALGG
jgi:hypothetical protein